MRIVSNLNDIKECPNCGRLGLIRTTNEFGRPFKQCPICTEEIYENETTCSEEEKVKKKDDFIFEMREEISNLTWSIHDSKTQVLVENIQNILNRIIDYIEEN
jgi:NifB/MoaA-like Fe-S oxidoreductase